MIDADPQREAIAHDEPAARDQDSGGPGLLYAIFLILWIIGVPFLLYPTVWSGEQLAIVLGRNWPRQSWAIVAVLHALAVLVPTLVGLRLARRPRYRAVFATLTLAGAFILVVLPVRLAGLTEALLAAALQVLCLAVFLALLWWLGRRNAGRDTRMRVRSWPALLLVPIIIWPWVAWGALGSAPDTALNLAAALLFGLAAALTVGRRLLPDLIATGNDRLADVALGGFVTAAVLITMGTAFGANGQQLFFLLLMPSLGWLAFGLGRWATAEHTSGGIGIMALLIGLVAAAPMMFIDPDELALVLNIGARDVATYALFATLISSLTALVLGVLVYATQPQLTKTHRSLRIGLSLVLWVALLLVYLTVGQIGWHGERLFVILNEQAELSAAAGISDPTTRRAFVYDTLVDTSRATGQPLQTALERVGIDVRPYYLVNGLEVDAGPLVRLWLTRRPEVDRILDSPELRPLPRPSAAARGSEARPTAPEWNLTVLGAPRVWDELAVTGDGVVIGQSDSGVDGAHPELSRQYRGNRPDGPAGDTYNWLDPWNGTLSPTDQGGHGTHTLGSVLGESVGVAPGASWIGCVNLARNLGNAPRYLDCLQFLLAPYPPDGDPLADGRPDLGADILNNSWGCPELEGCDAGALLAAVRALRAAGVYVVASAGNTGPACESVKDPIALYDEVLSVGAIDEQGQIAPFSSRGPVTADGSGRVKPDVVAPGVDVLSAFPGGTYAVNSGTSMAGPHVAGVVALMWSANPALVGDIEATDAILTDTARPLEAAAGGAVACGDDDAQPNNESGYGLVDAFAAVQEALDQR